MLATITEAKNRRVKSRVREHGESFEVMRTMEDGAICIRCRDEDCDWFGWVTPTEATWEIS